MIRCCQVSGQLTWLITSGISTTYHAWHFSPTIPTCAQSSAHFPHTGFLLNDEPKFLKSSTFLITIHCSPTLKLWSPTFTHLFCLAADNTHSSTLYISCYLLPALSTDHSVICRHHSLWTFKSAIITTNKRGLELILDADPPSPWTPLSHIQHNG